MARIILPNKEQTTIETIQGRASYSHTEREDLEGNWDDHWETRNGEFVIHQGTNDHHVYLLDRRQS